MPSARGRCRRGRRCLPRLALPGLVVIVACWVGVRGDDAHAESVDAAAPRLEGGAPFDEEEFVVLHEALRPGDEAWRSIPWETSLLEARERAVRERKPVYMLVRSGHPLGAV